MSAWYDAARHAVLLGDIDFSAAPLHLVLLGSDYTFDPAHDVDDLTPVAGPINVTVTDVVGPKVLMDDVVFPGVADGLVITGLAAYIDDGAGYVLPVAYIDRRADSTPVNPIVGDGGTLTFVFDYLVKI